MADLKQLGDYDIHKKVASGGMGTVYLATQGSTKRQVALKVLSAQMSQDAEYVQRFQREAQALSALRHPHVVQVYDSGIVDTHRYIAMEYLSGGTLQQEMAQHIIKNEPMPLARAIQITRQIASALDYAHKRGLVHRDIKPSNIMIAHDGRFVLTDFGIVMTQGGAKLTRQVETIGTPEYMSPEQISGKIPDKRSDLYSLGIVLYEMLAGIAPFKGENTLSILYKHVNDAPPPLQTLRPELSNAVQALVNKAIAKDPDKRFQTAGEFIQALDQAMLGKSVAGENHRPKIIAVLLSVMGVAAVVAVLGVVFSRGSGSGVAGLATGTALVPITITASANAAIATEQTQTAVPTTLSIATTTVVSLVANPSTQTPQPLPTETVLAATPTFAATNTVLVEATNTRIPITPTSSARAYLQAVGNENVVRGGPSKDYDVMGTLLQSVSYPVIGKTKDGEYDWWQITFPQAQAGFGWVRGDVVQFTNGNPDLVPTSAPWTLTPFSSVIRLVPSDVGENAIGQNGRSNTLAMNWTVSGASLMQLEITAEQNGAYDCPTGDVAAISPSDAVNKRRVLTLPNGEYPVTFGKPGYYVLNFSITRVDGGEQLTTRNVLVGCNRTFEVTVTPTLTGTAAITATATLTR